MKYCEVCEVSTESEGVSVVPKRRDSQEILSRRSQCMIERLSQTFLVSLTVSL